MKALGFYLFLASLLACNAQGNADNAKTDSLGTDKKHVESTSMNSGPGCGNSLLFHKGVIIDAANYDGNGNQISTSEAIVTDVTSDGGVTISHIESRMKKNGQPDGKVMQTAYKCDGQNLTIDMSNLSGQSSAKSNIETSGISFPLNVSEGETLPDATYSMIMETAGKTIKVTSHVTQRKVEAKESMVIEGGTFDCYKISSVMDVSTDMPGMDEKRKQQMEAMKAKMPKNKMVIWYAPDATILKMEYYMGDKLITKTQITGIKK